jgi:hypothetical protein
MKRLVALVALGLVIVGLVAVPASATTLKRCGRSLLVQNVSCQTGRKVLDAANGCRNHQAKTCRVLAFTCSISERADAVRCSDQNKLVVVRLPPGAIGPNGLANCELILQDDTGLALHVPGETTPIDGHGVESLLGRVSSTWDCKITDRIEVTHSAPLAPFHGIVDMSIENPLIGSNRYSCQTQGDFRCFGPRDGSNLSGSDLKVIYYVCVPGADKERLGYHLPGYCGKP